MRDALTSQAKRSKFPVSGGKDSQIFYPRPLATEKVGNRECSCLVLARVPLVATIPVPELFIFRH